VVLPLAIPAAMLIFRVGTAAAPFVMAAARSKKADRLLSAGAKVVGKVGNKAKDTATRVTNYLNNTVRNTSGGGGTGTTNAAVADNLETAAGLNDPELLELATNPKVYKGLALMAGDGLQSMFNKADANIRNRNYKNGGESPAKDTELTSMDDVNLLINVLNNSGSSPDQINAYMQEHLVNKTEV